MRDPISVQLSTCPKSAKAYVPSLERFGQREIVVDWFLVDCVC